MSQFTNLTPNSKFEYYNIELDNFAVVVYTVLTETNLRIPVKWYVLTTQLKYFLYVYGIMFFVDCCELFFVEIMFDVDWGVQVCNVLASKLCIFVKNFKHYNVAGATRPNFS